jgi:hypothetical protein
MALKKEELLLYDCAIFLNNEGMSPMQESKVS